MNIPAHIIKAAQHASRMAESDIDGVLGPKTLAAAREYDTECDDFDIPMSESEKLIITVAQHAAGLRGRDLDGKYGPNTDKAVRAYLDANDIEAAKPSKPAAGSSWAQWQRIEDPGVHSKDGIDLLDGKVIVPPGGLDPIPSKRDRDRVYGDAASLGEKGISRYLTTIEKLPGRFNKGNGRLPQVHKKVVPHIKLAFELFEKFGVADEIYKIWFFNYRHQRHDPNRPLSMHSWGIACDINPRENYAWSPQGTEKEVHPYTEGWRKKYPRGISQTLMLCMKKAGFSWGGNWPSFRDPMHFELLAR